MYIKEKLSYLRWIFLVRNVLDALYKELTAKKDRLHALRKSLEYQKLDQLHKVFCPFQLSQILSFLSFIVPYCRKL